MSFVQLTAIGIDRCPDSADRKLLHTEEVTINSRYIAMIRPINDQYRELMDLVLDGQFAMVGFYATARIDQAAVRPGTMLADAMDSKYLVHWLMERDVYATLMGETA